MHILAIRETGGAVLGNRALGLDELEPWVFIHGNVVQRGFTPMRPARQGDRRVLPTLSWWGGGYDVVQILANERLDMRRR